MLPYRRRRFLSRFVHPTIYWSFVNSLTVNAVAISGGSGFKVGDVGILHDGPLGSPPASSVPPGWTEIRTDISGTSLRGTYSYKVFTPTDLTGDALTSINGMDGGTSERKMLFVFRPSSRLWSNTIRTASVQGIAITTNPPIQLISTGRTTRPAVALAAFRQDVDAAVTAIGMTVINPAATSYFGYRIFNSGFADQLVDMPDTGAFNVMQSFYFTA
jgi:hypothetical protein